MSATPVKTTRFKSQGFAQCEQCQHGGEWTRERARQHANRNGHTVRFLIEDTTVYEPIDKDGA